MPLEPSARSTRRRCPAWMAERGPSPSPSGDRSVRCLEALALAACLAADRIAWPDQCVRRPLGNCWCRDDASVARQAVCHQEPIPAGDFLPIKSCFTLVSTLFVNLVKFLGIFFFLCGWSFEAFDLNPTGYSLEAGFYSAMIHVKFDFSTVPLFGKTGKTHVNCL